MKHFLIKTFMVAILGTLNLRANENEKALLGQYAVKFVKNGDTIALGTGTTVKYFIEALAEMVRIKGFEIKLVASSIQSEQQARLLGLIILDPNKVEKIDLMVDGADQVNGKKELIKGGGGALLREKMLALQARTLIIIAHKDKLVDQLTYQLPVEATPFAYIFTIQEIECLGVKASLRIKANDPYLTDNQNYIVDVDYSSCKTPLDELHQKIKLICGVVESGFFTSFNKRVFIAEGPSIIEL
jgi:ribose 5-phosphate isomerase A